MNIAAKLTFSIIDETVGYISNGTLVVFKHFLRKGERLLGKILFHQHGSIVFILKRETDKIQIYANHIPII